MKRILIFYGIIMLLINCSSSDDGETIQETQQYVGSWNLTKGYYYNNGVLNSTVDFVGLCDGKSVLNIDKSGNVKFDSYTDKLISPNNYQCTLTKKTGFFDDSKKIIQITDEYTSNKYKVEISNLSMSLIDDVSVTVGGQTYSSKSVIVFTKH